MYLDWLVTDFSRNNTEVQEVRKGQQRAQIYNRTAYSFKQYSICTVAHCKRNGKDGKGAFVEVI